MVKDYDIQVYGFWDRADLGIWVMTKSRMEVEYWEGEGHQNKKIDYRKGGVFHGASAWILKLASMKTWGKEENHDPVVKFSINVETWVEGMEIETSNKEFLLIVQEN